MVSGPISDDLERLGVPIESLLAVYTRRMVRIDHRPSGTQTSAAESLWRGTTRSWREPLRDTRDTLQHRHGAVRDKSSLSM